jgi:hypothetical protein
MRGGGLCVEATFLQRFARVSILSSLAHFIKRGRFKVLVNARPSKLRKGKTCYGKVKWLGKRIERPSPIVSLDPGVCRMSMCFERESGIYADTFGIPSSCVASRSVSRAENKYCTPGPKTEEVFLNPASRWFI